MMAINWLDPGDRHARIAQMIELFRAAKKRQRLKRAVKLWRRAEARLKLVALDAPPERVH